MHFRVAERVTRPTRVVGASQNHPPFLDHLLRLPSYPPLQTSRPRTYIKMAPPQLVQLYKDLQQTFMSGNLQQTGVLLARLKVRLPTPITLLGGVCSSTLGPLWHRLALLRQGSSCQWATRAHKTLFFPVSCLSVRAQSGEHAAEDARALHR